MKNLWKLGSILLVLTLLFTLGGMPVSAAEDDVLLEVHYYIPDNGEEPVPLPEIQYSQLNGSSYVELVFTLSPEECEQYFAVMTERDSVEFQLRFTGLYGVYINRIAYGYTDGTIQKDLTGEALESFVWGDEGISHTDLKISDSFVDEDYLEWDEKEQAYHLLENEDSYEHLITINAIWGMEVGTVRDTGKGAQLIISLKLDEKDETPATTAPATTDEPTKTEEAAPVTTAPVQSATDVPEETAPTATITAQQTETPTPNNGGNIGLYIGIGAVILVIAIVVVVVAMKKKK